MERKSETADPEIAITRVFKGAGNLVWSAWTDPKPVAQWWGPTGFTNTIHKMEVKVGGVWDFIMHGPDGTDYPNKIVFTEVVKPELLKFDHGSDDPNDPGQFKSTLISSSLKSSKTEINIMIVFKS